MLGWKTKFSVYLQKFLLTKKTIMKKTVLSLLFAAASICAFSQKINYRIGLVSAVPGSLEDSKETIRLGSSLIEANRIVGKKVLATANLGYLKLKTEDDLSFAIIPVMVGAKYPLNESVNFGISGGVGFYNKKEVGTQDFMFSPYLGVTINRISIDARYINIVNKENPLKTLALVFSYTL
jgi:hypothetical protein